MLSYSISVILESKATLFFFTIASSCACGSKQNHNLPISGSRNNCYSPAQPSTGYRRHASTPSSFQTNPLIKLLSDEPPRSSSFQTNPLIKLLSDEPPPMIAANCCAAFLSIFHCACVECSEGLRSHLRLFIVRLIFDDSVPGGCRNHVEVYYIIVQARQKRSSPLYGPTWAIA